MRYRVGLPGWKWAASKGLEMHLRVQVHHDAETGSYWASSPDLDGLVVSGATLDELRTEVIGAAETLLQLELTQAPRHVTADMRLSEALCAA